MLLPNRILLSTIFGFVASTGVASAVVTIDSTVSALNPGTGRFTYSYSVSNFATQEELISVVFSFMSAAPLQDITAPEGFLLNPDNFQGLVNLLVDFDDFTPQTFAPDTTISGFSFTSANGPGLVSYTAADVNQDYTGTLIAPVPEPSTAIFGLVASSLFLRRRR